MGEQLQNVGLRLSADLLHCVDEVRRLSMAFPDEMVADWIRGVVSLFWLATGGEGLLESGLYLRSRSLALSRISGFPIVLAILAFGFLSYFLASQQELSRQPTPQAVEVEIGEGIEP